MRADEAFKMIAYRLIAQPLRYVAACSRGTGARCWSQAQAYVETMLLMLLLLLLLLEG